MRIRTIILWTILLIIIDQSIKIIINCFFIECHFVIIPSLLEFIPKFNDKHTYGNVLLHENFNIDVGLWIHIVFFLIYQIIVLFLYDFLKSKMSKKSRILDLALIFQLSAMACVLIGNLIWKNGTLDYIYLKPMFIFDLKDLYNSIFICLFPLTLLVNRKQFDTIKMSDLTLHIKNRLKRNN